MKIVSLLKSDSHQPAIAVSEADLKSYLKHAYPLIHNQVWKLFVEEGIAVTPTTDYYDLDHEKVKEAISRKETSND